MRTRRSRCLRHRFPSAIISAPCGCTTSLSFRDVEDLLAERGILVSYETIRQWCEKFGPDYARQLRRRQGRLGDTSFLDEVFVTIKGQRQDPSRLVTDKLRSVHQRMLRARSFTVWAAVTAA